MIDLVLAASDRPDEPDLVAGAPAAGIRVVRRALDAADLLAAAAADPAVAVVISPGVPRLSADLVGRIAADGRVLVGLATDDAQAATLRAWGVSVVVRADVDPAATMVVVAARLVPSAPVESPSASEASVRAGVCIAVWGPAGAPGRTTTAISIAASLARQGRQVCLVDADTYAPDLTAMLGILDDISGLVVACRHAENGVLSPTSLRSVTRALDDGLVVLGGIGTAQRWAEVREGALRQVWGAATSTFDVTVVDVGGVIVEDAGPVPASGSGLLSSRRNAAAVTALQAADVVVAVGRASTLGVGRLLGMHGQVRELRPGVPIVHVVTGDHGHDVRAGVRALRDGGVTGTALPLVRDRRRLERGTRAAVDPYASTDRRERRAVDAVSAAVLGACA